MTRPGHETLREQSARLLRWLDGLPDGGPFFEVEVLLLNSEGLSLRELDPAHLLHVLRHECRDLEGRLPQLVLM